MREMKKFSAFIFLTTLVAPLVSNALIVWSEKEVLAPGVTVLSATVKEPRDIRYTAVRIDVKLTSANFFATPRCSGYGRPLEEAPTLYNSRNEKVLPADVRTKRETPAEFLQRGGKGAFIAFATRSTRVPYSGDFVDPRGLFMTDGVIVSNAKHGRGPVFVVRRDGSLEIADRIMQAEISDILVAQTGDVVIRRDGRDVVPLDRRNVAPCLALGLSQNARTLYILSADDGKKLAGKTGADYHDMNEAFESLGADDAISFEHGGAIGIFAADKNGVRQLNQLGENMNKARVASCLGISLGKTSGRKPPKEKINPAQVEGSFSMPKVSPVKEGSRVKTMGLRVQVKANLQSELQRIKRPVLSVSALYDIDGLWRSYDIVLVDQKVSHGVNINPDQTPSGVSLWQPEVSISEWRRALFGDPRRALFAECNIPATAKLIAYRLELWQNGGLVVVHESDQKTVKRYGAPEDWYVKGKYSGKITYRYPPPPEDKK